jgi:hypothetical protein
MMDNKLTYPIVTAEASGVFEGSPALIDCCFTEANNRVTSLRCG